MPLRIIQPGVTDRPTVLDSVRGLRLDAASTQRWSVEVVQLRMLANGLRALYEMCRDVEYRVCPGPQKVTIFSANIDDILKTPHGLCECGFHWYAVSLSSYCDLVWTVAIDADLITAQQLSIQTYRDEVLGPVRLYRDKVAAHFARVSPRKENAADLKVSVLPQLGITNNRLAVGQMKHAFGGEETELSYPWSLSSVHESLIDRFGWLPPLVAGNGDSSADPAEPDRSTHEVQEEQSNGDQ